MTFSLAIDDHPQYTVEQRWHVLQASGPEPEFELAPTDWQARRSTPSRALKERRDALEGVYVRRADAWADWVAGEISRGAVSPDVLERSWLTPLLARRLESGTWPEPQYQERWPELWFEVFQFASAHPGVFAEFAAGLPAAERAVIDEVAAADAALASAEAAAHASAGGTWPAEVALVQAAGRKTWPAFVSGGLGAPTLVSTKFAAKLTALDIDGWTTQHATLFDRKWEPRTSHRVLAVAGRFGKVTYGHGVESGADGYPPRCSNLGFAADGMADIDERPTLRARDAWVFASPSAASALHDADVPGLALQPLLYETEVPREFWDQAYRTPASWIDPLDPQPVFEVAAS